MPKFDPSKLSSLITLMERDGSMRNYGSGPSSVVQYMMPLGDGQTTVYSHHTSDSDKDSDYYSTTLHDGVLYDDVTRESERVPSIDLIGKLASRYEEPELGKTSKGGKYSSLARVLRDSSVENLKDLYKRTYKEVDINEK